MLALTRQARSLGSLWRGVTYRDVEEVHIKKGNQERDLLDTPNLLDGSPDLETK